MYSPPRDTSIAAPFWHSPPRITAGLRVKDGARYVDRCLGSLSAFVDDIVILDDGSTDDTLDLCRRYPKVTRLLEWPKSFFHEGMDRAVVLAMMADTKADWFLTMDIDEVFEERASEVIPLLASDASVALWEFPMYHFWNGRTHYRTDGEYGKAIEGGHRGLYRNQPGLYYPPLKIHCAALLGVEGAIRQSNLRIKHYGYADMDELRQKCIRYEQITNCPHLHILNAAGATFAEWTER